MAGVSAPPGDTEKRKIRPNQKGRDRRGRLKRQGRKKEVASHKSRLATLKEHRAPYEHFARVGNIFDSVHF